MNLELYKTLLAMGYRKIDNTDLYFKPVGYNVFCFSEKNNLLKQIFIDAQGTPSIWSSYNLEDYSNLVQDEQYRAYLDFFRTSESYGFKKFSFTPEFVFAFLTKEQEIALIFGKDSL